MTAPFPILPDLRLAVVIPARNEAQRITRCLAALAAQEDRAALGLGVFVVANGCTDETAPVARAALHRLGLPGRVLTRRVGKGGVGRARDLGVQAARAACPALDIVLTSDADCVADPAWAARMAAALTTAPAACGRILGAADDLEATGGDYPPIEVESRYARQTRRLLELLDLRRPGEVHDMQVGGANMGFRPEILAAVGGVPHLPSQEDRTLVARLRGAGHRVAWVPRAVVHASCRRDGRAPGGMAETLRLRRGAEDDPLDSSLRPFERLLLELVAPDCLTTAPPRLTVAQARADLPRLDACVHRLRALPPGEPRWTMLRALAGGPPADSVETAADMAGSAPLL
ncbi:glycosyltransferase family 2 protein [Roseivivax sp. CAU 1761]